MKFSVFTASTPDWTPEEAVAQLAEQGWDGVEWRVLDQQDAPEPGFWAGNRATVALSTLTESVPRIRELTAAAGLEISGIGGYATCDQHDDVETLLAATAALGAERVRVRVPNLGGAPYPQLFDRARRDYAHVAARAAHHGVKALVELHHQSIVSSPSAALRLLDGLDPAAVGVIHDLGNLVIEGGEEHRAGLEMLGDYLAHVHVKNCAWRPGEPAADGTVTWSHRWEPFASGQADVHGYLRLLQELGYDGWVTSEDFSTTLPLAERTAGNLAYLRAGVAAPVAG
ncbi:sugar phosphate isomerase/epimerase family protein [Pseudonocardia sp. GCM10023141]|uniref:sugar phosphate isomerase/epimerase family protein n=1 Tax=Pseudonocardia sp. GCM10023141 TaxID=3252653 RepID=UPI00360DB100